MSGVHEADAHGHDDDAQTPNPDLDQSRTNFIQARIETVVNAEQKQRQPSEQIQVCVRRKKAKELLGAEIILKDANGQQLINTRAGRESPLPTSLPPGDRKALEMNTIVVSDLFTGATARRPIISVNVPITVPSRGRLLLNASVQTSTLSELIRSNNLPDTWTAAIVDGQGVIIARSKDEDRFVSRKATADLQQNTRGPQGIWAGYTADGTPVLGAYARTDAANWRVAVGVPSRNNRSAAHKSTVVARRPGGPRDVLSALLATFTGRKIATSTASLAASAEALGRSEIVPEQRVAVRELDEIGSAVRNASLELAWRDVARKEAEASLREETERLD